MTAQLILMAGNNRWSNARLHAACMALQPGEWQAPRAGFFPSLALTLHHIHAVDLYYLDALTEGGLGPRAFREAPVFDTVQALAAAQETLDHRLIAFCKGLAPDRATASVITDRGDRGQPAERIDHLLLHLFQHQVHHRGQAHAMLSATSVRPPQLDDFFLTFERDPAALPFFE
ncbi:MAG: DinB family protein [Gemmobacter sp.]